jgi:predicted enzyme related to lactoylglutathione lyase
MSSDSTTFEAAVPILVMKDLQEAIRFYETVLGFQTGWTHGDPPQLASVFRDKVELNLRQCQSGEPAGVSKIYFELSDVDSLFARVHSCAADVKEALADRAYGMRDFSMRDPSGNELGFGMSIVN